MPKSLVVEFRGERLTVAELAARTGIARATLVKRISDMGWDVERAATTPVVKRSRGGMVAQNIPRPVPRLRRHSSGRAVCRWKLKGVEHTRYFGKYGTEEAAARYRRFMIEWANGGSDGSTNSLTQHERGVSVSQLAACWLVHVRGYYIKDGKPTGEVSGCVAAARAVNDLHGSAPAREFSPAALRACRDAIVARGLTRGTVNAYQSRIVRMFAWGAGQSLIPPDVPAALKYVEYLRAGRTAAPDRDRKKPATDAQVEATLPHLCTSDPARAARVADMVRIQRLAGMRPGEICAMAAGDIDTAGDVWRYTVGKANKNRHRGKAQVYYLGPKAVAILKPYLDAAQKIPLGTIFGEDPNNYGHAVERAAVKSGAGRWSPHQLRHALATAVAERFRSLEYAAAAIGDSLSIAAAVYVHIDPQERLKINIARVMG